MGPDSSVTMIKMDCGRGQVGVCHDRVRILASALLIDTVRTTEAASWKKTAFSLLTVGACKYGRL